MSYANDRRQPPPRLGSPAGLPIFCSLFHCALVRHPIFFAFALSGLHFGCTFEFPAPAKAPCGRQGSFCCPDRTCDPGLLCDFGVCVVCGELNRRCCERDICDLQLACGADGVCTAAALRGTYDTCRVGDDCGREGWCLPSSFTSNGGSGNLCSAACTREEQCPSWQGLTRPICVVSPSTMQGLCYPSCSANSDCLESTRCFHIPGTTTSICVPPGA